MTERRHMSLNGDRPYGFETHVKREPGRVVVAPVGELDIATADALERRITPLLTQADPVIVDLDGLSFIDVAGMHALLRCVEAAHARGGRLAIALGGPRVRRVFELCRMLEEFDFVYDSLAAVPR